MPGHLHRQPSGAWRLVVYAGVDPDTGRKRQVTRTFHGSKKDAGEELARLVLAVAGGRTTIEGSTPFAELCRRWLDHRAPDLSPGTVENYRAMINHLPAALAKTPVNKLQPHDLDRYYGQLLKAGLAAATIRRRHAMIRSALQQAAKWQLIPYNPAALASPPRAAAPDPHRPDVETVRRLLAVVAEHDPDFGVLVRLAAVTGARRAELSALVWSDIDLEAGTLTIARAAVQVKGAVVMKEPKSRRARTVALGADTLTMLAAYRVSLAERMLTFGAPLEPASPVFQSRPGVQIRPDGINHRFARLRKLAGADDVKFHGLRHAVATLLHDENVSTATVSKRLGHARQSTTSDMYTGTVDGRDRQAADVMDRLLG